MISLSGFGIKVMQASKQTGKYFLFILWKHFSNIDVISSEDFLEEFICILKKDAYSLEEKLWPT